MRFLSDGINQRLGMDGVVNLRFLANRAMFVFCIVSFTLLFYITRFSISSSH
jgi:hypothetical protein